MPEVSQPLTNLSLIVALARNGVIGRAGQLPWRLSADLRRFKQLTMGHHLIMGRKTYESIGRPLPGRTSIVLTRQAETSLSGVLAAHSLPEALQLARRDPEVFVIGGAEIYRLALPLVQRIYLTRVEADVAGDTTFPSLDPRQWVVTSEAWYPADDRNEYAHSFCILERSRQAASAPFLTR